MQFCLHMTNTLLLSLVVMLSMTYTLVIKSLSSTRVGSELLHPRCRILLVKKLHLLFLETLRSFVASNMRSPAILPKFFSARCLSFPILSETFSPHAFKFCDSETTATLQYVTALLMSGRTVSLLLSLLNKL